MDLSHPISILQSKLEEEQNIHDRDNKWFMDQPWDWRQKYLEAHNEFARVRSRNITQLERAIDKLKIAADPQKA